MYQEEIESAQIAFQMDQEEQSKQKAMSDEHRKEINCGKILQLRREAYKKGYDKAIEKACEWLKSKSCCGYLDEIEINDCIEQFKKAMEE